MRRLLVHPTHGKFRSQGSIEWPDDQYTRKRLADGTIKRVEGSEQQPAAAEPKPSLQRPVDQRRTQQPQQRPRAQAEPKPEQE
jgi:hypothetical protein